MPRANLVISNVGTVALLALGGCSNSPATPDGHVVAIDAKSIDAVPTPDAAPVPVTITAFGDDGSPAVGLPVAFLNADDSVVLETVTGADGSASATMAAGGSVTLAPGITVAPTGQTARPQVFTFLAVQPGDNLLVGSPAAAAAMNQLQINIPTADNPDGNGSFSVGANCGAGVTGQAHVPPSTDTSVMLSIPASCTTADLYIVAADHNGVPTAGAFIAQQALPTNGPLTLTPTFSPLHPVNITLNDLPGWTATMGVALVAMDGASTMFENGQVYNFNGNNPFQTMQSVVDTASTQIVSIVSETEGNGSGVAQVFIQRLADDSDETIELGGGWLPSIESSANYDTPSSGVIWTESGNSGPANIAYNKLNLFNFPTRSFDWNVVGPYTAGAEHFPHLPATLDQFNVEEGDATSVLTTGIADVANGYDSVRATVFNLLTNPVTFVPNVGDQVFFSSGPVGTPGS